MAPTQILISNLSLITRPDTPLLHKQWLLLENDSIHSFGEMKTLPPLKKAQHIDGTGKVALPGLINGHNHCAMTLFRGLADDLKLSEWLNKHIFPAEAENVTPEMVYCCSKLAAAEMILSGTTTVADGYFHEDQAARAFLETGLRAVPAQAIIDFPAPGVPDPNRNIAVAEGFLQKWQDKSPCITPALFAHSPYTCSPDTLKQTKLLSQKYNTKFFIHAAESRDEQHNLMEPQGNSPVKHLAQLGLLDRDTVLIHCVWLDDADRELISTSGSAVIVCPHSHCKLASGIAQVTEMKKQGIQTGLGTDGCASNNNLDMFQEMDLLAKIQKMRTLDATTMPANSVLAAATTSNAEILGLPRIGEITPGYKADLILLNMDQPHLLPFHSQDFLVYSATGADVETVIIGGRIILQDKQFTELDIDKCMNEVRILAHSLGGL